MNGYYQVSKMPRSALYGKSCPDIIQNYTVAHSFSWLLCKGVRENCPRNINHISPRAVLQSAVPHPHTCYLPSTQKKKPNQWPTISPHFPMESNLFSDLSDGEIPIRLLLRNIYLIKPRPSFQEL